MSKPVCTYTASDYAGLEAGPWEFLYGYEFGRTASDEAIWGFEVKRDGSSQYRMPWGAMKPYRGCPDQFEPQACLLFGIGLWLAIGKEQP